MTNIVIFGAGGRAGRAAIEEARLRGHRVTAVVRDPERHRDLAAGLVAGDVTDAESVARVAAGHTAAINAAVDLAAPPEVFFAGSARALVEGLTRAQVGRLVVVGLASVLDTADGTPLMDTPGYPQEYRSFYLGHAAMKDGLAGAELDWVVLSPAGDFDHAGSPTGGYRWAAADADSRVSYADFAVALLDEIDSPKAHRGQVGIAQG